MRNILQFYRVGDWYYLTGLGALGMVFVDKTSLFRCDFIWCLLIMLLTFSYGYSFNRMSDNSFRRWRWQDVLLSFFPFIAAVFLISWLYPGFLGFYLVAFFLNTLYSLQSTRLKNIPIISLVIIMYAFGILFLLGIFAAGGNSGFKELLMTFYIACFFIPIHLLHELGHAEEDKRYTFIEKHIRIYLCTIIASCIALSVSSFYLAALFSFGMLFAAANVLWGIFIFFLLKSDMWNNFNVQKAKKLRARLKIIGTLFGIFYLLAFVA